MNTNLKCTTKLPKTSNSGKTADGSFKTKKNATMFTLKQ